MRTISCKLSCRKSSCRGIHSRVHSFEFGSIPHARHPSGAADLIENARARPPHPRKLFLREGLPRVLQDLVQGFCGGFLTVVGSPRVSLKIFYTIFAEAFATDFLEKMLQNASRNPPGGSPEHPRSLPEQSQNVSRQARRTTSEK